MNRTWIEKFYEECGREVSLAYNTFNQTNNWGITLATGIVTLAFITSTKYVDDKVVITYPNIAHWFVVIIAWVIMTRFFVRSCLALVNMYRWNTLIYAASKMLSLPEDHPDVPVFERNLAKKVKAYFYDWRSPIPLRKLVWECFRLMYIWFFLVLLALIIWGIIALHSQTLWIVGVLVFLLPTGWETYAFLVYRGFKYQPLDLESEPDVAKLWLGERDITPDQETVGIQERQQKEKGQTVESEMKSATKPQASGSGDVSRQLAGQLKTVFVAALLSLWAATLRLGENVPVKRGAWLPWVIASVFLFFWVVYRREKIRWPKLRWVLPFVAVALLWLMYLISGFSFPIAFYTSVAIGLLAWTVLLLVVLLIVMTRGLTEGKMDRTIRRFVTWGGSVSLPVTLFVLLTSVLLGWTRLWNAGMRGWWMDPLLYLGTIIVVVVALVPFRRADN